MKKRGVWLKVPSAQAELIPVAKRRGFDFHHAEREYLMMTKWLPAEEGIESSLPPNASHQVGVGACVVNEKGELLVVRERHGPLQGLNVFKIPTGLVHAGEDLPHAAEREVLEETGVRVRFRSIISFRHVHGAAFGKSDLFFVARLDLDSENGDKQELQAQASEIMEVRWMSFDDFMGQGHFHDAPLYRRMNELMRAHASTDSSIGATEGRDRVSSGEFGASTLHAGWRGDCFLYHGKLPPADKDA